MKGPGRSLPVGMRGGVGRSGGEESGPKFLTCRGSRWVKGPESLTCGWWLWHQCGEVSFTW